MAIVNVRIADIRSRTCVEIHVTKRPARTAEPNWSESERIMSFKKIQQKIVLDGAFRRLCKTPLIHSASGKGGSGKTTVAAVIGLKLSSMGYKVAIGDFDQTPNLISALNKDPADWDGEHDKWNRYVPLQINPNLKVMSFQLLKARGEGYYLTGKNLMEHINQLLYSTAWGKLDYIITDNPSGSYDSLELQKELFRSISVIIVTEPHPYSIDNCEDFIDNCLYSGVNIFGVVENRIHYICDQCSKKAHLHGQPQGAKMAKKFNLNFLGGIPEEARISGGDISHLMGNGFALNTVKFITNKNWNWR